MSDPNETTTVIGSPAGVVTRLSWAFWMLCTMEMFERLAYFGMRVVVGVYIAQADLPGGLHFTQAERGSIFAWWFIFQSVLPTFTGGFADRYGYKRTIFVAIVIKVIGYLLMATQRSYWGFWAGTMILAIGTAIFKPGIQGSLAQQMNKENSSKGWGIFYWLVNVGAMMGPPLAGMLRKISWPWVFYACAIIVSVNFLMLLTYRDKPSGYDKSQSFWQVFVTTMRNLMDARLLAFLGIMSCFWLMMYQVWDLHPLFVTDWVDSSGIVDALPIPEAWTHQTDRGVQVLQENLLNLNAFLIVLFVIPLSIIVARMRTLTAMLIGMLLATAGTVLSGQTMIGWIFLGGILFFSFGEMLTGPKKNQYLALIAPPDRKALYLGYVNLTVGVGGFVGSKLSGWLYGDYGEKAMLAQKYLAEKTGWLAERGGHWNGEVSGLTEALGVERTDAYDTLKNYLQLDGHTATNLLWDTYQPYQIWYAFAAIGVLAAVALVFYNRAARNWADMDV